MRAGLLFAAVCLLGVARGYELLWNVGGADGIDLSPYPLIQEGRLELFTTYFGRLPVLEPTGKWCNGGIPQLANISAHAAKVKTDLLARINSTYDGYVVVDYESWWASWNATGAAYRNASIALAALQHPSAPPGKVLRLAVGQYNAAAQGFLVATLDAVRSACPRCKAGLYSYPLRAYWNGYCSPDGPALRNISDSIRDVFLASDALFPSIYQFYPNASRGQKKQYVDCMAGEAVRVAAFAPTPLPVLPYGWPRYHDPDNGLLDASDADLEFAEPGRVAGVAGAVVWGDAGNNATRIAALASWLADNKAIFTKPPSLHEPSASRGSSAPAGDGAVVGRRSDPSEVPEEAVAAIVRNARASVGSFPPPWTACSL